MKTLDEITQMMAAGDTAQADEALKELLAKEPDNLQAKMLYGTCRQLLGDEETFSRVHDEVAAEMVVRRHPVKLDERKIWDDFHGLWLWLTAGGLVLAGVAYGVCQMTKNSAYAAYRGPAYERPDPLGLQSKRKPDGAVFDRNKFLESEQKTEDSNDEKVAIAVTRATGVSTNGEEEGDIRDELRVLEEANRKSKEEMRALEEMRRKLERTEEASKCLYGGARFQRLRKEQELKVEEERRKMPKEKEEAMRK